MRPLKHIILTILLYMAVEVCFIKLGLYVLIGAIVFGVLVDIIDHGAQILFLDTQLSKDIRKMLRSCGIWGLPGVYMEYYIRRKGEVEFMFIHNPIIIVIILGIAVFTNNWVIWLGLIFHFFCDLYENTREGRLGKFIKSPIKMYQYLKGETTVSGM